MSNLDSIVQIKSNNLEPGKGSLLLSEPFMNDYYFGRSVVLLVEHNHDGSFGVVLNKVIDAPINDVLQGLPEFDAKVYVGGPVETTSTFFIHTLGNIIEDSLEIGNGLYWGGDIEMVKELITLNQLNPANIRFFIGYSGWGENQLKSELKRNSWLVSPNSDSKLLSMPIENMWSELIFKMGPNYKMWTKMPIDPGLN